MVAPDTVHFCADTQLGRDVVSGLTWCSGPASMVEDGAGSARSRTSKAPVSVRGSDRPLRTIAARRPARRQGADRQFRRDEGGRYRGRVPSQPPLLYRRRARGRAGQYRRRHHHLQLRRVRQIAPRSAPALSSARTSLVAPVKVGDGAYVGAGSVVTRCAGGRAGAGRGRKPSEATTRAARQMPEEGA